MKRAGERVPGGTDLARSAAFREASLKSEVTRAYAVVGVVLLVSLLVVRAGADRAIDPRLRVVGLLGVAALLGVQVCVLAMAFVARRAGRGLPAWFVIATVVVEGLIPTAMMFQHISGGVLPPYATLGSPPLIAYGLMITLTTLRLRPWLCVLAGAVGAGSYGLLLLYIRFGIGLRHDPAGLPNAAFINSAMLILISGIAGAWVAREIRRHAEAALGEERTRAENDRMERDLAVARSIQQALVPRGAPEIAGFEVCGWNRPADQTGGDYYDWQRMPDGNWIVTLADVSGHGVGPAMVTAACRAYVRASSAHHGDLPSLATRINRLLAEDLPEGRFITMVNVLIDPRGGPLSLLSAGHSPIVLYIGGSGAVEDILPQDMPLAVVADQEFGPARAVEMKRGDVLALVTDGFVEWSRSSASGKGEMFGLERLRQSLKRHAALAGPELIAAVTADAEAFAGGEPQQDDLTMVVIRRTG